MENWYTASVLASFPGHSHSQYRINARDTYNFPAVRTGLSCSWKQLFAVGSTAEVKYKSFEKQSSCRMPILAQSSDRYWNGWADCDSSLHDVVGFYCCHVTKFWNLIGTANFLAAEVTVWTRQAISPTAWEQATPSSTTECMMWAFKSIIRQNELLLNSYFCYCCWL